MAEVLMGLLCTLHWEWTDTGQGRIRTNRQEAVTTTEGREMMVVWMMGAGRQREVTGLWT